MLILTILLSMGLIWIKSFQSFLLCHLEVLSYKLVKDMPQNIILAHFSRLLKWCRKPQMKKMTKELDLGASYSTIWKSKEKVLKKVSEKKKSVPTYIQCFSSKTIQARRQQGDIFREKTKNHPNILFTMNISIKNKK